MSTRFRAHTQVRPYIHSWICFENLLQIEAKNRRTADFLGVGNSVSLVVGKILHDDADDQSGQNKAEEWGNGE